MSVTTDPVFLAHLVVFGGAAVACFVTAYRARAISDADTRRGLVALLVTSGGWAAALVLFLVVPSSQGTVAFYQVGLVLGVSTVGPWLYFCSAYTGRSFHRNTTLRWVAVAVFLGLIAVKLTNPLHQLYFRTEIVSTPFPHLAIQTGLFHWLVMGLSYALASVGYFMLFELFMRVGSDSKPFLGLVSVTGLPVLLDVVALRTPYLLELTYEPVGVAVFAVGVCFVYLNRFQTLQKTHQRDDPAIVVSEADRIREYNASAEALFPAALTPAAIGEELETVLPVISDALAADDSVFEHQHNGERRFYQVTTNPFGSGEGYLGRLVLLTDVTHRERYRRELERQNERLDRFASTVSHDLRNPLNVAQAHLELAADTVTDGAANLEKVAAAHTRMEAMIEDLLTLAREGQPIGETESVAVAEVADRAWDVVETENATLVVDGDVSVVADEQRVQHLFENLFRNAVEHGGPEVTVHVGPLPSGTGFYIADDGPGIPPEERETVFDSGYTTTEDGTGFGLAITKEIVDAHGWEIGIVDGIDGGTRFEITGVGA